MRTALLFFTMIIVIVVGLYLKHKGILFKSNTSEEIHLSNASDTTLKTFNSVAIEPSEKWSSILIGKWKFLGEETNEHSQIEMSATIEFSSDKRYKLYGTQKYWDIDDISDGITRIGNEQFRTGGRIIGTWEIEDNSFLKMHSDSCDFKISRNVLSEREIIEDGCMYFESRQFGNRETKTSKVHFSKFNQDTIQINGDDYSKGGSIEYIFTRIE